MHYVNRIFENLRLEVSGNRYDGCTFTNCEIVFTCREPHHAHHCTFIDCRFTFEGPADDTIAILQNLYSVGGEARATVERIIASINKDPLTPQVPPI